MDGATGAGTAFLTRSGSHSAASSGGPGGEDDGVAGRVTQPKLLTVSNGPQIIPARQRNADHLVSRSGQEQLRSIALECLARNIAGHDGRFARRCDSQPFRPDKKAGSIAGLHPVAAAAG